MRKPSWNDGVDDVMHDGIYWFIVCTGVLALCVVLFVAIVHTGLASLQLPWQNQHTQMIHATNEYVTTKQTLLVTLVGQYDQAALQAVRDGTTCTLPAVAADHAQMQATLERVRLESQSIDASFVPAGVTQFLGAHPENQSVACP